MSWYSLNIVCPVNYAAMAVLSIWSHQNYVHLQCLFSLFRSIHLRLVASMLCFSDKWSVLGHFNHLDNKLAIKGPMGPNFLTAWEKAQKFQFCHFWPFSVCAHFASSFWQSSCDFSSIKILLKSYSSNLIISSK